MKRQSGVHTLLGLLIGVVIGQWLTKRAKSNRVHHRQAASAKPQGNRKFALEDLLRLIEENNGPKELDLSGRDLSGLDLSSEALQALMKRRGITLVDDIPVWVFPCTSGRMLIGLNLGRVNLQGANLQRTNFHGADLTRADLQGADLRDACLRAVNLYRADLRSAKLWRADMRGAIASLANFSGASLYRVLFENTQMVGTDLSDALFESTNLSEVRLNRQSIGTHILQERPVHLRDHLRWDDPELTASEWDRFFVHRLERAREIYTELRSSFLKYGFFDDASWAHFKERSLERQMHSPGQARLYYGDELPEKATVLSPHWWWFYLKHTAKWFWLWGSELSCGYGEKPLRSIWWAAVTIVTFPFLYWAFGGIQANGSSPAWIDYLNYSFGAFTTIGFARFETTSWIAETLTGLEALLGISILALLMFALGNRMSRS